MAVDPEKNYTVGLLLDIYGELLTQRQKDILDLYYNDDLSLSEVAQECGITRQGVRDAMKKAEEQLTFLEEHLNLLEKQRKTEEVLGAVLADLERLQGAGADTEAIRKKIGMLL